MKLFTHLAGGVLAAVLIAPVHATTLQSTTVPTGDPTASTDTFTIVAVHEKPSDALRYDTTFHAIDSGWGAGTGLDIGYVNVYYKNAADLDTVSYVSSVKSPDLAAVGCKSPYGSIDVSAVEHTGVATAIKAPKGVTITTEGAYLHIMKGACTLPDGLYRIDVTVKTFAS